MEETAFKFFTDHTSSIEVVWHEKKEKIFFPKLPCCNYKNKKIEDRFLAKIIRDNVKTKVLSLTNKENSIKSFMQAEESLVFFVSSHFF